MLSRKGKLAALVLLINVIGLSAAPAPVAAAGNCDGNGWCCASVPSCAEYCCYWQDDRQERETCGCNQET